MKKIAFLPFMMLGIGTGAFLCDCDATKWRGISIKDVALLIGLHATIIPLGVFFARRKLLGLSARMWSFAITLCYVVGLAGIVQALRPELFSKVASFL
jgi:hypothetical protein